MTTFRRLAFAALLVIIAVAAWLLRPLSAPSPPTDPPAPSYTDADSRIARLRARDTLALHSGCATQALLHGHTTPRAIVLLHGITNCPLQFHELALALHARGDNVLIPRVAHHGLADRMTEDLARLTAEELAALASECAGIARGLGDTVVFVGLSTSGVMAAWAAQHLDAVDRAVVIAPAFAPPWRPAWIAPLATRAALRLPNVFVWWDDEKKQALPGPTQCYPRFATRALAESYRLGEGVLRAASLHDPRAQDLAVVTSAADHAIDNARAGTLAARWRAHGAHVRELEFEAGLDVNHDMIDPRQVGAKVEVVYPALLASIRGEALQGPPSRDPAARDADPLRP